MDFPKTRIETLPRTDERNSRGYIYFFSQWKNTKKRSYISCFELHSFKTFSTKSQPE